MRSTPPPPPHQQPYRASSGPRYGHAPPRKLPLVPGRSIHQIREMMREAAVNDTRGVGKNLSQNSFTNRRSTRSMIKRNSRVTQRVNFDQILNDYPGRFGRWQLFTIITCVAGIYVCYENRILKAMDRPASINSHDLQEYYICDEFDKKLTFNHTKQLMMETGDPCHGLNLTKEEKIYFWNELKQDENFSIPMENRRPVDCSAIEGAEIRFYRTQLRDAEELVTLWEYFSLVCDKDMRCVHTDPMALFDIPAFITLLVVPAIADAVGRRRIMRLLVPYIIVNSLLLTICVDACSMMYLIVAQSLTSTPLYVICHVFALEVVTQELRSFVNALCFTGLPFLYVLQLVKPLFDTWQSFFLTLMFPSLLVMLCYLPFVLESPRWVFAVKSNIHTHTVLMDAASHNLKVFDQTDLQIDLELLADEEFLVSPKHAVPNKTFFQHLKENKNMFILHSYLFFMGWYNPILHSDILNDLKVTTQDQQPNTHLNTVYTTLMIGKVILVGFMYRKSPYKPLFINSIVLLALQAIHMSMHVVLYFVGTTAKGFCIENVVFDGSGDIPFFIIKLTYYFNMLIGDIHRMGVLLVMFVSYPTKFKCTYFGLITAISMFFYALVRYLSGPFVLGQFITRQVGLVFAFPATILATINVLLIRFALKPVNQAISEKHLILGKLHS